MNEFLRIGEATKLCGVPAAGVRRWANARQLASERLPSGQRVFRCTVVDKFLGFSSKKPAEDQVIVLYARASDGSKALLNTQVDMLRSSVPAGVDVVEVKDSGSGLNDNRPGLKRAMRLAREGKVSEIRFTNKDRLTRFGYGFLEQYFRAYGVNLIEVAPEKEKTLEEELLQDFMNLVASFSGKFYRIRGYEQQRKLLKKAEEQLS